MFKFIYVSTNIKQKKILNNNNNDTTGYGIQISMPTREKQPKKTFWSLSSKTYSLKKLNSRMPLSSHKLRELKIEIEWYNNITILDYLRLDG